MTPVGALRAVVGILCAAGAAALGALVLGEYEFTGTLPFLAGPLFGLVVGEIVVGVGATRSMVAGFAAAALAFGGLAWAGWIDAGEGLEPVKGLAWVAAALAAGVAFVRTVGLRRPGARPSPDDVRAVGS